MARVSEKTFEVEGNSFRNISGIFWGSEREYPIDPFSGILEGFELEDMQVVRPDFWSDTEEIPEGRGPEIRYFGRGGLFFLDRNDAMKHIGDAAGRSDTDFAEALWDSLGIDISEELERSAGSGLPSDRPLQDLTAKFGTDAFGTYCPWHAFGRSGETPWGFYLFFEKLIEWAAALHRSGQFLPDPKPSPLKVFQLLWLLTYRHELFHFQVELYATRLESALRHPIYRPYVECVRTPVMNSERWWEEALAQAVVLRSNYVKRTLEIDSHYVNSYMVPYFLTFPNGYRHFQCKRISGGVAGAHRLLSAQIARTEIDIPEETWNTDLSLAKSEYRIRKEAVPGYLLMRPESISRFQLQTPRLKDVVRYIRRQGGEVNENAPGDHKHATLNGQPFHLNYAKRDNTLDLASAKALARILGIKVRDLNQAIA
jgi:hypothetical protein